MSENELPDGLRPGRSTPSFSAESVPAGLLRAHHTTTWAELVVENGAIDFVWEGDGQTVTVRTGERLVIPPNAKHHVKAMDPGASFHVQFYEN